MAPITAEVIADMDDTAAWAHNNIVHLKPAAPANRANDATIQQCYTALQQSLAHYRAAGRMTAAQEQRQHLMLRAGFMRAEAGVLLDEQWEAYGTDTYFADDYRPSRAREADVSACMSCWHDWDANGHDLYQALLHRAECIEAEAKAVQS